MAWLRWVMVPVVLFVFNACSAEATDTGGETNWLVCERDEDCEGSGFCVEGTCSSTDDDAGKGTSTNSGGAAGSGGDGTSASGSAGSTASASGGSTGGELTCGGDVLGTWRGVVPGLPEALSEDPEHDGCWNIMFYDNNSTLGVTSLLSRVSPDLERTLTLRIASDGTQDEIPGLDSNAYQAIHEVKGPITQSFGPECMTFAGRQVACEELSEPLTRYGNGEGVWQSVVCMPATNGGCDCLLDYWGTLGEQGTWQLVDDQIVLTRFAYYSEGLGVEATSDPIDYCVATDALRFGTPMNDWWNELAGVPLTRLDCEDPAQVDPNLCSFICPTSSLCSR